MNSNAAVFGLQESGYGSPGGGYPTPTPEQLQAFYGAAVGGSTGSSGAGVTSSGNELRGGGGSSTTEPGSPITSPYGLHSESRNPPPETKYEPSHSPTHTQSGIISSDNGLQYANLDGSLADTKGYPSSGAYTGSHPHQASYQGHHASLLQASYAHHYGKASSPSSPLRSAIRKLIITLPGVCQTEHSVCQGGRKTRFGASRSSIQPSKQPIWDFEPLIFCRLKIFFLVLVKIRTTNLKDNCTEATDFLF